MKRPIIVSVFILLPVVMVVLVLRARNNPRIPEVKRVVEGKKVIEERVSLWATNRCGMVDEDFVQKHLPGMLSFSGEKVSDNQISALESKLAGFYRAYSQTNFEAYERFRFETSTEINTTDMERLTQTLTVLGKKLPPSNEVSRVAWASLNGTNRITHFCSSTINVHIEELKTNNPNIFYNRAAAGEVPQIATPVFLSPVIVKPTPVQVLKTDGRLICADVQQYVQFNSNNTTVPLHILFYWSGSDGVWIPWKLFGVIIPGYRTVF